jgi:hypothetical protein
LTWHDRGKELERRTRAKVLLRTYVLQGVPAPEAVHAVVHHPDLAGNPPSENSVRSWYKQITAASADLIDDEIRDMVLHPLADVRRGAIARVSARIEQFNVLASNLREELSGELAAAAPNVSRIREIEARLCALDVRISDQERHLARITSIDTQPLEAHLSEADERKKVVDALCKFAHLFEYGELTAVLLAFIEERRRRDAEMAAAGKQQANVRDRVERLLGLDKPADA